MIAKPKRGIALSTEDKVVNIFVMICMVFVFLVTAYPFYYVIVMSFNEGKDALAGGIYFWPRVWSLDNYTQFLTDEKWLISIGISIARTVLGAGTGVFFTCLVAYGLSFTDLALRKFYYVIMIVCMYFSGGLIPYYLTIRSLGLCNNFLVYIIPNMFSVYNMILAVSFFQSLPHELYESAHLDGANDFLIYLRIVLPLSKPLLATLVLFMAVSQWNSWMDTAFYCSGAKNLRTLAYLLRDVIVSNETGAQFMSSMNSTAAGKMKPTTARSVQMAAMVIAILPIITVYPFLQKYFVSGIMLGAVKG